MTYRARILLTMGVGFGLMALLLIGAVLLGYSGVLSIDETAQELVREHLINSPRGAAVEQQIETQSHELLSELVWVLGVCLALAAGSAALTIRTTIGTFRQLEWQADELNRVSWQLVHGHEMIARRFSHEMHDELGQSLTGLRGILKRVHPSDFETRRPECVEILDDVLRNVRELSQLLRPVILDDFGLDAGITSLVERSRQRTGLQIEYHSDISVRLSEQLETHLYRIAQEALTNIARHSGAKWASVRLQADAKKVGLTIEDNGRGLRPSPTPPRASLGLIGMRARARQVNGEVTVENRAEGGLRIAVEAPLVLRGEETDEQQNSDPIS